MQFADELKARIEFIRADYPQVNLAESGAFIKNLLFTYHVIVASEPLLEFAIERTQGGSELHAYLVAHLEEEHDHSAWLADDLSSVDVDVTSSKASHHAVEIAGSVYYRIAHQSPVALLGYMAVLEMFPTPLAHVEAFEAMHGRDLCRTLRYHAEHDIDHGADLADVLNSLPDADRELVLETAIHTACLYSSAVSTFT